jgi:U3 small nucleolar RNA-associated protein 25
VLSRFDAPEIRALLSQHCANLAGRLRLERGEYAGTMGYVRDGVKQTFERVDLGLKGGEGPVEEVEKRLEWFTKKVSGGAGAGGGRGTVARQSGKRGKMAVGVRP